MRLAPRLALTFGLLAIASTGTVGFAVRERLAHDEAVGFERGVRTLCLKIQEEVTYQAESDQKRIAGACLPDGVVGRAVLSYNIDTLDADRNPLALRVKAERETFLADELMLAMQGGEILGATPTSLISMPSREVDALLLNDPKRSVLRGGPVPAIVSRCVKEGKSGRRIGIVAARQLSPFLARLGGSSTIDVTITPSWIKSELRAPEANHFTATCSLPVESGAPLTYSVSKSTNELDEKQKNVDQTVGFTAVIAGAIAFFVAIVLGLRLGRPLDILAREAGKVAAGEAHPIQERGSGEVKELARAYNRMLQDLAVTRRRLAAASRVAAWREVARRVAHEVKNPLAPIRAAVETLRRLRAREDPRFDDYFDEATRTVLDEVHRISNIVTEFTRFARLPQPRPTEIKAEEVAQHVVGIHKAAADGVHFEHVAQRRAPSLLADRDQVIQVLTNLVQNAFDSVKGQPDAAVTITTDTDGHYVTFSVVDNGPGIAPEIAARLFEPYATTKGAAGTGLGLAIAQRIALEHNGELSYIGPGSCGGGAVFRLLLPVEGPAPMSELPPGSASDV